MSGDGRARRWLEKAVSGGKTRSLLGGIGLAFLGILFLLITFWSVYAVFWFITSWFLPTSHEVRLIVSGAVLLVLFWGNLTTSREYLDSLSFSSGTASNEIVNIYVPGVGMGSTMNPLAPDSMHSFVKIFTSVLYTGPRTIMASIRCFRERARLSGLDMSAAGAVMTLLFEKDGRVSFEEVCRAVPGMDPGKFFTGLSALRGVLFLKSDPPGLMLSSELRSEIAGSS